MKAVNLIPVDERGGASAGAGRSGGGAYVVLGLLGGLTVLALLYGISAHQISSRGSQVASLNAHTQQAQTRASQLAAYTSFVAMRQQRVQAVSQIVDSRFDWAHAFHELGRVLPSGISLISLDGTVGSTSGSTPGSTSGSTSGSASSTSGAASSGAAATVTSATPPGSVPVFTITGCATSQAEVALMLNRLRLIDGVSEVALQSSTKSSSGSGAAGSGGCESGYPAFALQATFDALPGVSGTSSSSSTTTISSTTSGAAPSPSGGGSR
jgi:Tfp pilus assembly protein PilN